MKSDNLLLIIEEKLTRIRGLMKATFQHKYGGHLIDWSNFESIIKNSEKVKVRILELVDDFQKHYPTGNGQVEIPNLGLFSLLEDKDKVSEDNRQHYRSEYALQISQRSVKILRAVTLRVAIRYGWELYMFGTPRLHVPTFTFREPKSQEENPLSDSYPWEDFRRYNAYTTTSRCYLGEITNQELLKLLNI
jgi:hypothetical protein